MHLEAGALGFVAGSTGLEEQQPMCAVVGVVSAATATAVNSFCANSAVLHACNQ